MTGEFVARQYVRFVFAAAADWRGEPLEATIQALAQDEELSRMLKFYGFVAQGTLPDAIPIA